MSKLTWRLLKLMLEGFRVVFVIVSNFNVCLGQTENLNKIKQSGLCALRHG